MWFNKFTSKVTGRVKFHVNRNEIRIFESFCYRIITELFNGIRHNIAHLYDLSGLISSLDIILSLTKVKYFPNFFYFKVINETGTFSIVSIRMGAVHRLAPR